MKCEAKRSTRTVRKSNRNQKGNHKGGREVEGLDEGLDEEVRLTGVLVEGAEVGQVHEDV